MTLQPWQLYTATGPASDRPAFQIPEAPPWRRISGRRPKEMGATFKPSADAIQAVNAALHLRRPLLVTGKPGVGKSSLAESIAWDLGLGEVLRWPISSRSTVADGVYRYDAIARLHETQLNRDKPGEANKADGSAPSTAKKAPEMSRFLSLGPLGTALAATEGPRVLLVDELDKSDIDFPNDLLNILEDGEYEIAELARMEQASVEVNTWKGRGKAAIAKGLLIATHFPIVVFTSNGEREFPPAFLRRCVRLELTLPSKEDLLQIVENHLGAEARDQAGSIVDSFLKKQTAGDLPNDYLLNAVYLATRTVRPAGFDEFLEQVLLRPISGSGA